MAVAESTAGALQPAGFRGVPSCLMRYADERRWVVWRWETRKGKPTKPPLRALGGRVGSYARNDDPQTWATLDEALEAHRRGGCAGIGLMLLGLKGFGAIDLDHIRKPNGTRLGWAQGAINRAGSYAEDTPSGQGARILGTVPLDWPAMHTKKPHPGGGEFELYANMSTGRYITVTGEGQGELADISAVMAALKAEAERQDAEAELWAAFAKLPQRAQDMIAHGGSGDRSADFQSAVNSLRLAGWSEGDALRILELHPSGPAAKYAGRLSGELRRSWGKAGNKFTAGSGAAPPAPVEHDPDPVDLWGRFDPPGLPDGLLPGTIESFARLQGDRMGADPAGLAMAALVTCAAAISDRIKVKVKRHDDWTESARLWAALVGSPSTKKSPILSAATGPLHAIDTRMFRAWQEAMSFYNAMPKDERGAPPPQTRLRIEDATVEAAQQVLTDSPDGVLLLQDELSGFFGAMDKYGGGKAAMADRAFWLRTFNGGAYALNRVGRGASLIPNASVCLLGGIQPEPIAKLAADAQDDGLLQRLFPIVLRPATIGHDEPAPDVAGQYRDLVENLHQLQPIGGFTPWLQFSDSAQAVRRRLEAEHLRLQTTEAISRKLAAHVGKYDGLFARLCVVWHCIEAVEQGGPLPETIGGDVAERVAAFLHRFLLRHAFAFYGGVLGLSDDHDRLSAIAGYILAHRLERITNRDVQRGDSTMRKLKEADTRPLLEQLAALGWLTQTEGPRPTQPPHWIVNPAVHERFAERAEQERSQRDEARKVIAELVNGSE